MIKPHGSQELNPLFVYDTEARHALLAEAESLPTLLLNSAAETAKAVADQMREEGKKVGVLSLNVLRPFPGDLVRDALKNVKTVVVGDRADSYGADGGNLSLEVRAAIQLDPDNHARVATRIYGLGGKDFDDDDAIPVEGLAPSDDDFAEDDVTILPAPSRVNNSCNRPPSRFSSMICTRSTRCLTALIASCNRGFNLAGRSGCCKKVSHSEVENWSVSG